MDMSKQIPTCKNYYDEDGKYVWVLCQNTRGVHRHVPPAECFYLFPNQLIKGCTPGSGDT